MDAFRSRPEKTTEWTRRTPQGTGPDARSVERIECAFTDGAGRPGPDALPSAKAGIASHKADPKAASMSRMTLHPTTEAVRITLSPGNARPSIRRNPPRPPDPPRGANPAKNLHERAGTAMFSSMLPLRADPQGMGACRGLGGFGQGMS